MSVELLNWLNLIVLKVSPIRWRRWRWWWRRRWRRRRSQRERRLRRVEFIQKRCISIDILTCLLTYCAWNGIDWVRVRLFYFNFFSFQRKKFAFYIIYLHCFAFLRWVSLLFLWPGIELEDMRHWILWSHIVGLVFHNDLIAIPNWLHYNFLNNTISLESRVGSFPSCGTRGNPSLIKISKTTLHLWYS